MIQNVERYGRIYITKSIAAEKEIERVMTALTHTCSGISGYDGNDQDERHQNQALVTTNYSKRYGSYLCHNKP